MAATNFRKFPHCASGNLTVITALSVTVLAGVAGTAMLFAQANAEKAHIQGALDAGVLAGTALGYSATDSKRIEAAEAAFYGNASNAKFASEDPDAAFTAGGSVKPVFTVASSRVRGIATSEAKNSLGTSLGITEIAVKVDAQAEKMASEQLCVLTLSEDEEQSLYVYGNAHFNAENCAVQANSSDPEGMQIDGSKSTATAARFGVTGNYSGSGFTPTPTTDVEPVADPYASLPVPVAGACVDVSSKMKLSAFTLNPGTYCGGLTIKAGATVKLNPGIYIMKDGPFEVSSGATVTGEEIMIALTGANSYLYLLADSTVRVTSPVSGTYKNIQFMSDRDLAQSKFQEEWTTILAGAILEYDGVMYLPEQQFWVSGTAHDTIVKGSSPTMAMVVDKVWAQGNAIIDIKREDRRGLGADMGVASFAYGAKLVR